MKSLGTPRSWKDNIKRNLKEIGNKPEGHRKIREEHRLMTLENRVLRRIYGCKRKWRGGGKDCKMRSFITCTIHLILLGRRMKWVEHAARMRDDKLYKSFAGKPERKRPCRRRRRRR